jgi:RNA polymerase sigma factor (sigma-70 family)
LESIKLNIINEAKVHFDQKYIDGLVNNDSEIIEDIYKKYAKIVVEVIQKNGGDEDMAKDILQDVLLSIWRQGKNGLKLRCSFQSFLLSACKKRYITVLQSKYSLKTISKDSTEIEIPDICANIEELELVNKKYNLIKEKMMMLGPSCKEIIELSVTKAENGKYISWIEVAERLDISYGYVRKKAVECKERLFTLIKKDPNYNQIFKN